MRIILLVKKQEIIMQRKLKEYLNCIMKSYNKLEISHQHKNEAFNIMFFY